MLLDLPLGLGEKSEIPALAQSPGGITESQRTRVPQGVEQAQPAAELAYALSTPGEMIGLLARCLCERVLDVVVQRRQCLALVQRLGADLAAGIDPHQRGRVAAQTGAAIALG